MPGRRDSEAEPRSSFALVLGGGGARGLAHIPVLEALDEIGLRPAVIAGASIGAVIGSAYAAGLTGKDIRRHVIGLMHNRGDVFSRLMSARAAPLSLSSFAFGNPALLDAEKLCASFLPEAIPETFERLATPLVVVATDFYGRCQHVFESGPLRTAIAASMSIPGLVRPMEIEGRVYVDGAATNPLPFDCVRHRADFVVAVDTTSGPTEPRGIPDPWDALFSTIQLMGQSIVAEKLKQGGPDIVLRPNVAPFRLLDFLAASAILRSADAVKPEVKSRVASRAVALSE